jgi:acyl dehydratase
VSALDVVAWHAEIDRYVAEANARRGETKATPVEPVGIYDFPIAHRSITEDRIALFANAVGDPNPLWRSADYARRTRRGGIVAPPVFESCCGELPAMPNPPQVHGWNAYNAGNRRSYRRPIRPGDEIRAEDTWLGVDEKTRGDRPYRLFMQRSDRTYSNQRDEVVCVVQGRMLCTATPPGAAEEPDGDRFADRVRRRFDERELAALHAEYEDELSGRFRRGAEARYWEDVEEGEELPPVVKGPYDVTDAVSFFGAIGYSAAFALKWQGLKADLGRCPVDPETGEFHHVADWHLQDAIARVSGMPYAHAFGTHMETMLVHPVTNWMGDDGVLEVLDTQLRAPLFHGELSRTHGRVTRKLVEEGRHLVELELWSRANDSVTYSTGTATVRLPARAGESNGESEAS